MRAATEDPAAGSPSALAAAAGLMYPFTSSEGYLLAYGSHADGLARSRSDLDILIVTQTPWPPAQLAELRATVIELHHAHGLDLDTEVSYEVKLTASHAEIRAATHLEGFPTTRSGKTRATRVTDDPAYLNSDSFKLRLLLNALSSPHVFLGGDLHRYEQHTTAATTAIAALAIDQVALRETRTLPGGSSVLGRSTESGWSFTLRETLGTLLLGPHGEQGQDYLGYTQPAPLLSVLTRGLHQLRFVGIAHPLDGATWTADTSYSGAQAMLTAWDTVLNA